MSVKIKDNTAQINIEMQHGIPVAIRLMLEDIEREANPKTPRREGGLRKSIRRTVVGPHGEIEWAKEYAVFQEKKQYQNYTTPGTGPHFAENAVRKVVDNADYYFEKAKVL